MKKNIQIKLFLAISFLCVGKLFTNQQSEKSELYNLLTTEASFFDEQKAQKIIKKNLDDTLTLLKKRKKGKQMLQEQKDLLQKEEKKLISFAKDPIKKKIEKMQDALKKVSEAIPLKASNFLGPIRLMFESWKEKIAFLSEQVTIAFEKKDPTLSQQQFESPLRRFAMISYIDLVEGIFDDITKKIEFLVQLAIPKKLLRIKINDEIVTAIDVKSEIDGFGKIILDFYNKYFTYIDEVLLSSQQVVTMYEREINRAIGSNLVAIQQTLNTYARGYSKIAYDPITTLNLPFRRSNLEAKKNAIKSNRPLLSSHEKLQIESQQKTDTVNQLMDILQDLKTLFTQKKDIIARDWFETELIGNEKRARTRYFTGNKELGLAQKLIDSYVQETLNYVSKITEFRDALAQNPNVQINQVLYLPNDIDDTVQAFVELVEELQRYIESYLTQKLDAEKMDALFKINELYLQNLIVVINGFFDAFQFTDSTGKFIEQRRMNQYLQEARESLLESREVLSQLSKKIEEAQQSFVARTEVSSEQTEQVKPESTKKESINPFAKKDPITEGLEAAKFQLDQKKVPKKERITLEQLAQPGNQPEATHEISEKNKNSIAELFVQISTYFAHESQNMETTWFEGNRALTRKIVGQTFGAGSQTLITGYKNTMEEQIRLVEHIQILLQEEKNVGIRDFTFISTNIQDLVGKQLVYILQWQSYLTNGFFAKTTLNDEEKKALKNVLNIFLPALERMQEKTIELYEFIIKNSVTIDKKLQTIFDDLQAGASVFKAMQKNLQEVK